MTAVLPVPVTEEVADAAKIHWSCVTQWEAPFFALCGDLPIRQQRIAGAKVTCPQCLPLIVEHVAACDACLPFAARYFS